MYQNAIQAYKKVGVTNVVADADPHRVIQMLYQGLLENMAYAKGCIERKDMVGKGKHLSKSMSIIFALQSALDMEVGEISLNLYNLYDYMHRQLTDVLVRNDAKKIDEVVSLLVPIKMAWDKIPDEEKQRGYKMREEKGQFRSSASASGHV
ncbi:flagellar export chaperone FliS [Pokkaliibacter plantistimulans]|uniref:Flagellar secretion chaperone FliS n=1 Tax=Proteobacteria bacterium 228 TaxID=2083153 RepID=A0A2S5KUR2_9PROT|nr:flagellar export chaperone FliS [Pokkaliibacter plantistimulans]PPC78453.1 flagellar export chaperone FliS [Pokkaliibacter plantistimulans]